MFSVGISILMFLKLIGSIFRLDKQSIFFKFAEIGLVIGTVLCVASILKFLCTTLP